MKKQMIIMCVLALASPLMAQETNPASPPESMPAETPPERNREAAKPETGEPNELERRQLRIMGRALKDIGITEEQLKQILVLQAQHMEKMTANWQRINKAREELSRLQEAGATIEELDAAIVEVSEAQAEQLHILVRNRLEMERILGKEKNDLFMEKARQFYRSHGRRPGAGMPPRPNIPPIPGIPPAPPTRP